MAEHAKLSASSSERWLNCTRAPRFEEQFPEPPPTEFSEEGTAGHLFSENALAKYLGLPQKPIPEKYARFNNAQFQNDYMVYVNYCINLIKQARLKTPNAIIFLERRVDFSTWVPEGFGTCDLIIVTDDEVMVVDLKFGRGISVDAKGNSQLRLYGAGAVSMFDHLYEIKTVTVIIVQPRINNITSEVLSKNDLIDWMDQIVSPSASLAWNGQGQFVPGEHCRWCRGKSVCAARAQANLELARFDFAAPESMDDESIAQVLSKAAMLHSWVKDIEEYAYRQALSGRKWPGYKLVIGRSTRKFIDSEAVESALIDAGVEDEVIYERSLRPMTDIEKKVGKNMFATILGDLVAKAPGKPTLVPVEDRRPEFQPPVADPAADFSLQ